MQRRWTTRLALAIGLIAIAAGASWTFAEWRFEAGLARARSDLQARRFEAARRWLAAQAADRPDDAEIAYMLGVCERAMGRAAAAVAAWSRVPPASRFGDAATEARAGVLIMDLGRFGEAEDVLRAAMARAGRGPAAARFQYALAQLLYWQGRLDEMRRLSQEGWDSSPDRPGDLHDLWRIDDAPPTFESIQAAVDRAGAADPEDDRVWLARANLAIQAGRFDEASRWIEKCRERRPDDPVVWRARLRWARASDRLDEARECLPHLPANRFNEAEALALRAWLDGRLGRPDAERAALEALVDRVPGDTEALERLASLAIAAGRPDRAAELRRRKSQIDQTRERYYRTLEGPTPDRARRRAGGAGRGPRPRLRGAGLVGDRIPIAARRPRRRRGRRPARAAAPRPPRRRRGRPDHPRSGRRSRVRRSARDPGRRRRPTPRPPRGCGCPRSATTPRRPACASPSTTADRRTGSSPRRPPAASACSTTTATAGSTSTSSRAGHSRRRGPVVPNRRPAVPQPGRRDLRGRDRAARGSPVSPAVMATAWPSATSTTMAIPTCSSPDGGRTPSIATEATGPSRTSPRAAGLAGDRDWPTSAAFADLDGDGDLDLYVCHYLVWDAEHPTLCPRMPRAPARSSPDRRFDYCMPHPFPARPDHLFRNDGGRFVDVTAAAGIVESDGRGLGVVAADVDGDGRIDLFVANDTTANYLWHNLGGMKFEEVGISSGVACSATGAYQAGMGTAPGRPRRRRPPRPVRHQLLRRVRPRITATSTR